MMDICIYTPDMSESKNAVLNAGTVELANVWGNHD